MADEGEYQLTFKSDPAGQIIDDDEQVLHEDRKAYKYLTKDGEGKAIFSNGDVFEGKYENKARNGKGSYKFAKQEEWVKGASFSGDYKDDLKNGFGIFEYPDRSKYVGSWKNDLRDGQGTYYYSSGHVYKGSWKEGKKHGKGVYAIPTEAAPPLKLSTLASEEKAKDLAEKLGVGYVSIESLVSAASKSDSELGKVIKGYLEARKTIPLKIVSKLVESALESAAQTDAGWVLEFESVDEAESITTSANVDADAFLFIEKKGSVNIPTRSGSFSASSRSDLEWCLTLISASSVITGSWNNGKLNQGKWAGASGSSYMGAFAGSVPGPGGGIFLMKGGSNVRGNFAEKPKNEEEEEDDMESSVPDTVWKPTNICSDPVPNELKRLDRIVRRARIRIDQDSLHKVDALEIDLPGVPNMNFLSDGPPHVYGFGTPTLEGIPEILKYAKREDKQDVLLIVTRRDPVCYITEATAGDKPSTPSFAPCLFSDVTKDLDFSGAEPKLSEDDEEPELTEFQKFDIKWAERVVSMARDGGKLSYVTSDGVLKEIKVSPKSQLMSLTTFRPGPEEGEQGPPEVQSAAMKWTNLDFLEEEEQENYIPFADENGAKHIPLPDEGAPSPEEVDNLLKVLTDVSPEDTAIAFCNRTGAGIVPFCMALTGLIHWKPAEPEEEEEEEEQGEDEEGEESKEEADKVKEEASEKAAEEKKDEPMLDLGAFTPIADIISSVSEGKGPLLKVEVDDMTRRCAQVVDLVKSVFEAIEDWKSVGADSDDDRQVKSKKLKLAQGCLSRYATLLAVHIYNKSEEEEKAESFAEWLSDERHTAVKTALDSIKSYEF